MEEQTNLEEIGIGDKETTQLEAKKVKIVKVEIKTVGEKGSKKVNCECQHPDKTDGNISISSAKVERKGNLEISGLWFNTDETEEERKQGKIGNIRKGSVLALFLTFMKSNNVKELENKEVETVLDQSGYLAFKAY